MTTQYVSYPNTNQIQEYPSAAAFPTTANNGALALDLSTDTLYVYSTTSMTWVPIATPGDVTAITALTGDVQATGPGVATATIQPGVVTLAKMNALPADTIIGNNTGSSATPLALTTTQVTAMLNLFSSSLQGLTPASGGGTSNFLRADGTWATPAGTGVTSVTASSPLFSSGGDTPNLTIQQASGSQNGYLSSTDWTTFNNKASSTATFTLGSTSIALGSTTTAVAGLTTLTFVAGSGVVDPTGNGQASIAAQSSSNGFALIGQGSVNDSIFYNKNGSPWLVNPTGTTTATFLGSISASNLSGTNSGDVTLGTANGLSLTGQVLSLGTASTSTTGALTSTDWNTFNSKASSTATFTLGTTSIALGSTTSTVAGLTLASPNVTTMTAGAITLNSTTPLNGPYVFMDDSINTAEMGLDAGGITGALVFITQTSIPTYFYSNNILAVTIDTSQNLSVVGNVTGANLSGTNTGNVTLGTTNGLSLVSQQLSLAAASTSTTGALTSTDWNTFNSKQASGSYITALTGDVTASGPGSAAASLVATSNSTLTTLSGLTTASSLASIGTITTGTWHGTAIANTYLANSTIVLGSTTLTLGGTTTTVAGLTLTTPVIATIDSGTGSFTLNTSGTITVPSTTDTLAGIAASQTLTNKTISGSSNTLSNIGNGSLTNSSVTVGSTSISLGSTAATISGLTVSAGTFTGTSSFPGSSSIDGSGNAILGGTLSSKTITTSGDLDIGGANGTDSHAAQIYNKASILNIGSTNGSTGTVTLASGNSNGFLFITDQEIGDVGIIALSGSGSTLHIVSDPATHYSVAAPSAGDGLVHLSYSSGVLTYTNETGSTLLMSTVYLRVG